MIFMPGDYVEVVADLENDPDELYIGSKGHIQGEPYLEEATKKNPVCILLEDFPSFGSVAFHPEELKLLKRGKAGEEYDTLKSSYEGLQKREQVKTAIWDEQKRRLEGINRFVAEQAMRDIGTEYYDIMRAIDFILKMPVFDPEDGHLLSVQESLSLASKHAVQPPQTEVSG